MIEWAMAHPYMTFFLVALLIVAVDNTVLGIARCVVEYRIAKKAQGLEPPKGDDHA